MSTIKLIRPEETYDGYTERDVLVDGVRVGSVDKGGPRSTLYYPWYVVARKDLGTHATRKAAVAALVSSVAGPIPEETK